MCSNLNQNKQRIAPGATLISTSFQGPSFKQWGIGRFVNGRWFNGRYNARYERLSELYKNFDKSYIEVDSFYEGKALFYLPKSIDGGVIKIACVENEDGLLILTRNSDNTPIKPYHGRTAIVIAPNISNGEMWVRFGKLIQMDYHMLKIAS